MHIVKQSCSAQPHGFGHGHANQGRANFILPELMTTSIDETIKSCVSVEIRLVQTPAAARFHRPPFSLLLVFTCVVTRCIRAPRPLDVFSAAANFKFRPLSPSLCSTFVGPSAWPIAQSLDCQSIASPPAWCLAAPALPLA